MNEADPRIELRIARQTFFDAGHSDQNQTDAAMIKDVSHLLKPCHLEPIRFLDDESSSRIRQGVGHSRRAIPLFIKRILHFVLVQREMESAFPVSEYIAISRAQFGRHRPPIDCNRFQKKKSGWLVPRTDGPLTPQNETG